ncbi:MAG: M1 family aminopeptidase [Acidobacteriota bacterium]
MWTKIFRFELRYQLRRPLFPLSAVAFFGLGLALGSSDVGSALGDAPGTLVRNAPILAVRLMPIASLLGLFVMNAFVASAALRDTDGASDMFFFTKPLTRASYFGGRFAGSMAVSALVLLAAAVGLMLAQVAPWQPDGRVGPFGVGPYLFGALLILLPNLLVMGSLFFALAIWSRRVTLTYLCVVVFIGLQDALEVAAESLGNRFLGGVLEPSGLVALDTASRYWTLAEQSSRLPELGGVLLANRLAWLGLAAAVLALAYSRFDFTARERRIRRKGRSATATPGTATAPTLSAAMAPAATASAPLALPATGLRFAPLDTARRLARQVRIEVSEVVAGPAFVSLLAFGLILVAVGSVTVGSDQGIPSYPLTHHMVEAIGLGVRTTLLAILVLYAGELVFHRRTLKLSQVYDALPVSNGLLATAKVLALSSMAALFLLAATATTMLSQHARGFQDIDLGVYAQGLAVLALPLAPVVVLAVCFQVLANRKVLGLLWIGAAVLAKLALPRLGFENNLYLFGGHPKPTFTAFNGYGHHAEPFVAFMAYWGFGAVLLWLVTLLFWTRGTPTSGRARWTVARRRWTRSFAAVGLVAVTGMGATGLWIGHQADGRGGYVDRDRVLDRMAAYETAYRSYADAPLPTITSVSAEVDLYPEKRRVDLRGRYRLENLGDVPIQTLPITRSPRWVEGVLRMYGGVSIDHLDLPPHRVVVDDDALGFYVFELEQPIAPGETFDLGFTVTLDHGPFGNNRHNDLVVENGTFFSNRNVFPVLGYATSNQVPAPAERTKRDLEAVPRMAELGDAWAARQNYLEADWIEFEAVISTATDQLAIAPGDLVEQWTEDQRAFFRYRTSAPMVNLFPILSGRYAVARDRWNDIDLEIYHHPDHAYNLDRIFETTRQSLAYLTESLGPYPHRQLRIVEVPSYHGKVAFAFAGTLAYSESWGFTADLDGAELDWLSAVLAHEVSHQWWNHQVVPAHVQGSTFIAEALPQYGAMMILERMYGPESVRHFLRFHLDRYLERRGNERIREMPLARVENQDYIHYSKASLALYTLQDLIGEDAVNRALRSFLEEHTFVGPPYPQSTDLLGHLRRETPPEHAGVIEDLFESITLFDNQVLDATSRRLDDGRFEVRLDVSTRKLRDDGLGETTEVSMDDWIDIGVFAETPSEGGDGDSTEPQVLLLEKRHLTSRDTTFTVVVGQPPTHAGIDPYNKRIDRDSGDNVRPVRDLRP